MNTFQFIWKSLKHNWPLNLLVVLGIAVATAVIAGALVVGDSMRWSLRRLTLERLGRIDQVLLSDRFFRVDLAHELSAANSFSQYYSEAQPAILFPNATAELPRETTPSRARGITIVGCVENFWNLGTPKFVPQKLPGIGEVVLNHALAIRLNAKIDDRIVLRIPRPDQVPADSPLGKKDGRIRNLPQLQVIDILPTAGLGRFGLNASQLFPLNAYLSLEQIQSALDKPDQCNTILCATDAHNEGLDESKSTLSQSLRPLLEDFGIQTKRVQQSFRPQNADDDEVSFECWQISSDRLLIEDEATEAVLNKLAKWNPQPILTYLANSIRLAGFDPSTEDSTEIPYSTITAVDSTSRLGPLKTDDGVPSEKLRDNEIVLNSWAAERLNAQVGDRLSVTYFEPETTHGQTREAVREFKLKAIVKLVRPDRSYSRRRPAQFSARPAPANDPDLTPEVPGVTDQDTIANWDPPFPFDQSRIRAPDDEYWSLYRTTPKAFVSLQAGRQMWASRFGNTTSIRFPISAVTDLESLSLGVSDALQTQKSKLGFQFLPVKRLGLQASRGTAPFQWLFLGFSFFILAAAIMLISLLFRLNIERRASQIGLLESVGWTNKKTEVLLRREGIILALFGGVLGTGLGIAYAWLMLVGLKTWWLEAVVTPFLNIHVVPTTLLIGFSCGCVVSFVVIRWTIRQMVHLESKDLLQSQIEIARPSEKSDRWRQRLSLAFLATAIVLGVFAPTLSGEAQAGAFFGSGASVLIAALSWIRNWLRRQPAKAAPLATTSLTRVGICNAQRNPGRSALTIGLIACATFLIVAISAFRLAPTTTGTGGFQLIGNCDQPIYQDLNATDVRNELMGSQTAILDGVTVLSLPVRAGDDASCRNLYQANQPRILGVPTTMIQYFSQTENNFCWAATDEVAGISNPWKLLQSEPEDVTNPVPVVIDKNTAVYGLHLYKGVGEEFEINYSEHSSVRFRVVGLLANSILQGSLLISEENLKRLFPDVNGFQYFLVNVGSHSLAEVQHLLENTFSDNGLELTATDTLLGQLLAVQNTYLSTFQSLGGLGLLLGTAGLAIVQLRNVMERRGELGLLRATGFSRRRIGQLIFRENSFLLLCGLGIGLMAALIAIIPHLLVGGASIPTGALVVVLGLVLLIGFLAALAGVRMTVRAPLVAALRNS